MTGGDLASLITKEQQEPRLLSHYADDDNMIDAYREGRDLYAMIASKVYHNNYEDNKEFVPDGTMNIEGKHRRQSCKSLLLGELTLCPNKTM